MIRKPEKLNYGVSSAITSWLYLSGVKDSPEGLVYRVREARPDTVALSSAAPEHRQALLALENEILILRPMTENYCDHQGYTQKRLAGFGVMGEYGPELVADGALTERSVIAEELARQKLESGVRKNESAKE